MLVESSGGAVFDWAEQVLDIVTVIGPVEVDFDQPQCGCVDGDVADLSAFAVDAEMHDALTTSTSPTRSRQSSSRRRPW